MASLTQNITQIHPGDLSFGQVKSVRSQVKRDCSLLRNRVRMLQVEMERANKKIKDTSTKTQEVRQLKQRNDMKFIQKLEKERDHHLFMEQSREDANKRL